MKLKLLALFVFAALTLSSCMVARKQVGNYEKKDCKPVVYKEGLDFYLFWETIALRKTEKNIKVKDYEVVRRRGFMDYIVFYGSVGIFSPSRVQVKVKNCDEKK